MVLQKRLAYGFNGYRVPTKRRTARSAKRRALFQRKAEDNQMCAFDLLATIAGTLLQEKQDPTTSSNGSSEKDQHRFVEEKDQDAIKPFITELTVEAIGNKPLKSELSDEGSCDRKCLSTLSSQVCNQYCCLKENPPEIEGNSCIASVVTSSSCSERFVGEILVEGKSFNEMKNFASKVELGSYGYPDCNSCKLDVDVNKVKDGLHKLESDDSMPRSPLSKGYDNVTVVSRDDDENFSGCVHPSSKTKSFRPKKCIGDQRIRKRVASKYRKVARESKHDTLSNNDGNLKPAKNHYKHQISQMNIPFKKRKLFNCSSASNSNGYIKSGRTCYSPKNDMSRGLSYPSSRIGKDSGTPSLEAYQRSALRSKDSHVNLRIKSFRVPELFIEIPETATIASLKREVMEAVTALLQGGMRVGMILHGKKLRDDSKTLLETGISHDNQLDALGFTLEPSSSQKLPLTCAKDPLHVPTEDMPPSLIGNHSSSSVIHQRIPRFPDMLPEHQATSVGNLVESDHDSAPSPINTSGEKKLTESKELMTVPEMATEALAVLPMHKKPKRTEFSQRRIRRPFSVAEVEALVEAVENLGTGRWRDVKLRAFDDAKHRTYVDLK